jgi:glycosyltransferase involved in cell wall biosynthesis
MNILIYSDSPVYGGHEEMLVRHLSKSIKVAGVKYDFVCASGNSFLIKQVSQLRDRMFVSGIYEVPSSFVFLDQFRLFYSFRRILLLISVFIKAKPDLVVNVAGRIESCNLSLWVAKLLRVLVVCYVPMVHKRAYAFGGFGDSFRDCFNHLIFSAYDNLIVLTRAQREHLNVGFRAKTAIVHNFISVQGSSPRPYQKPRFLRLGYLGRLENRQKNVLSLIPAFISILKKHTGSKLIIQGEGPCLSELVHLIKSSGCEHHIELRPWQSDVAVFYSDVDIILLPSRYEGVSLVMLQSLLRSKPVIATKNSDFAEFLPLFTLFNTGDVDDLVEVLGRSINEVDTWSYFFDKTGVLNEVASNSSRFTTVVESMFCPAENNV